MRIRLSKPGFKSMAPGARLPFSFINKDLFLLAGIWIFTVIIVNPRGEFPLADDWIYLDMLKLLHDKSILFYSDYPGSTVISQLMWALVWCKFFGYSILLARFTSLADSFLLILVLYFLLQKLTSHRGFSFFGTALFIFNPVFYVLSFTFMTEPSFCLVVTGSITAAYAALKSERWSWILLLIFLCCVAVLIKQTALIIPVSFFVIILFNKKIPGRLFSAALLSLTVTTFAYAVLLHWINHTYGSSGRFMNRVNFDVLNYYKIGYYEGFSHQRENFLKIVMYCGMFMLPVFPILVVASPPIFAHGGLYNHRKKISASLIALAFIFACLQTESIQLPNLENFFYNTGLGPVLLRDVSILKMKPHSFFEAPLFWRSFSVLSMTAGLYLLSILSFKFISTLKPSFRKETDVKDIFYQLLYCAAMIYIFLLVNEYIFDRYILLLTLLIILMLAVSLKDNFGILNKKWYALSLIILLPIVVFTVSASHDYLAWNRARWDALNFLTGRLKISPGEIDGGYEFNGLRNYSDNYSAQKNKSWWWVYDDKYLVTMNPVTGYQYFFEVPYYSWIKCRMFSIQVLKKTGDERISQDSLSRR
jgi:hypothetical protein